MLPLYSTTNEVNSQAIFGIASLAYAVYGHFKVPDRIKRQVGLEPATSLDGNFLNFAHMYSASSELGRSLDQLQAAYNGSERVLVMHHPCR
jgi:hypothetical protein